MDTSIQSANVLFSHINAHTSKVVARTLEIVKSRLTGLVITDDDGNPVDIETLLTSIPDDMNARLAKPMRKRTPQPSSKRCRALTAQKKQCTWAPTEGQIFCKMHIHNHKNGVIDIGDPVEPCTYGTAATSGGPMPMDPMVPPVSIAVPTVPSVTVSMPTVTPFA